MKPLLVIVAFFALAIPIGAQQSTQYDQEAQEFKALAVKLYPDCAVAGSPLARMMYKVDSVMKANGSKLYNLSSKPLILAIEAGSILNLPPHWEALTEGERNNAFDVIASGLVSTVDLTPPASTQPTAAASEPFNPGSINDDPLKDAPQPNPPPAQLPESQQSSGQPTVAGFHYFLFTMESQGHLMGQKNGPVVYRGGPMSGMTEPQAMIYAQHQWEQLPLDQQMVYENDAKMYGDPITKQAAEAAAHPVISGTIQDANTGAVQYIHMQ
jgi:hypothetical protein